MIWEDLHPVDMRVGLHDFCQPNPQIGNQSGAIEGVGRGSGVARKRIETGVAASN